MTANSLRIVPLDFRQVDGEPRDQTLYAAVQEWAKKHLDSSLDCRYYSRCWVMLNGDQVIGLTGLRNSADCVLFHLVPPSADRDGLKLAMEARDIAITRMRGYLQDLGMSGSTVLIRVEEKAQPMWRKFLERLGAKPAHRFEMQI